MNRTEITIDGFITGQIWQGGSAWKRYRETFSHDRVSYALPLDLPLAEAVELDLSADGDYMETPKLAVDSLVIVTREVPTLRGTETRRRWYTVDEWPSFAQRGLVDRATTCSDCEAAA